MGINLKIIRIPGQPSSKPSVETPPSFLMCNDLTGLNMGIVILTKNIFLLFLIFLSYFFLEAFQN